MYDVCCRRLLKSVFFLVGCGNGSNYTNNECAMCAVGYFKTSLFLFLVPCSNGSYYINSDMYVVGYKQVYLLFLVPCVHGSDFIDNECTMCVVDGY